MAGFTKEEDNLLLRLRADGLRWYEIADQLCWAQQVCMARHAELMMERARNMVAPVPPVEQIPIAVFGSRDDGGLVSNAAEFAAAEGSKRLLQAQLRTGQFFGAARAAWLARHDVFA